MDTPSTALVRELFYGTSEVSEDTERDIDIIDAKRPQEPVTEDGPRRPSLYVGIFEEMIRTVCEHEGHLLSQQELCILDAFSRLCYNNRYCLIRLLLRKPDAWHTLESMESFTKEVGFEGLKRALSDLSLPVSDLLNTGTTPMNEEVEVGVKKEELDAINLSSMSTNDYRDQKPFVTNAEAGSSRLCQNASTEPYGHLEDIKPTLATLERPEWNNPNFDFFCEDTSKMSLPEVLNKLSVEHLKALVRDTKVKPRRPNKPDMVAALLLHSTTQSVLPFKTRKGKFTDGLRQTLLPFKSLDPKKDVRCSQQERLMEMALKKLGQSYRVNVDFYWLIVRLNVIYERSTEYPKSLLVPSLLTSFKKRVYPEYAYRRSSHIWRTREELLEFVEALRIEAAIEDELEPPEQDRSRTATKTPALPSNAKLSTPATPTSRRILTTPLRTPKTSHPPESPLCKQEVVSDVLPGEDESRKAEEVVEEVPIKEQKARNVLKVFDEKVFPRWTELVAIAQFKLDGVEKTPGLERFEPGYVYTRIISKAMHAMATLKLYQKELAALEALLAQRLWRRGKRARWYERRAILLTKYLSRVDGPNGTTKDLSVIEKAMEGVKEALEDPDTHLVLRPSLVRRLRALEKRLKIPPDQRVQCDGELRKVDEVYVSAERIHKKLKLDSNGRPIKKAENGDVRTYLSSIAGKETTNKLKPSDGPKWKGKSLWKGKNGDHVNVEARALEYYEDLGYKGFHSESRILTTLFALLFWDVIFADVPGAFETPHQTAPLDLAEDTFYHARSSAIENRLQEIQQKNRALEIVAEHDVKFREKNTWCVGVRWDICERKDLLDIVECLGGESLAMICRLLCEDYSGRNSGVPDLVVWNVDENSCKFVEVKGPNDRPQENQKLWFDSLLGAYASVEICHVFDQDDPPKPKQSKKGKKGVKQKKDDIGEVEMRVEPQPYEDNDDKEYTEVAIILAEEGCTVREYVTRSKMEVIVAGVKRQRSPELGEETTTEVFAVVEEENAGVAARSTRKKARFSSP